MPGNLRHNQQIRLKTKPTSCRCCKSVQSVQACSSILVRSSRTSLPPLFCAFQQLDAARSYQDPLQSIYRSNTQRFVTPTCLLDWFRNGRMTLHRICWRQAITSTLPPAPQDMLKVLCCSKVPKCISLSLSLSLCTSHHLPMHIPVSVQMNAQHAAT